MQTIHKQPLSNRQKPFLATLIILLTVPVISIALLLSTASPFDGIQSTMSLGLLNFQTILRTYLFRIVLIRTAQEVVLTIVIALPAALLLARILHLGSHKIWLPLLLAPALFPISLTPLLWRPLLDIPLLKISPLWAIMATAIINAWRLLPWGILLMSRSARLDLRRVTAYFALWIIFATVIDSGLILLFTAGEPYNATHTWASWLAVNVWVTRNWGASAASAIMMSVSLMLWLWSMQCLSITNLATPHSADRPIKSFKNAFTISTARSVTNGIVVLIMWIPLWSLLTQHTMGEFGTGLGHFPLNDLLIWTITTIVVILLSATLARAFAPAFCNFKSGLHPCGPQQTLHYLAIGTLPLWPVALSYCQLQLSRLGMNEFIEAIGTVTVLTLSSSITIACLVPLIQGYITRWKRPYVWAASVYILHCSAWLQLWSEPRLLASGIVTTLPGQTTEPALLTIAILYTWILIVGSSVALLTYGTASSR